MSGVGQAAFILLPGPAHEQSFLVAVGPVPVFISRVTARVAGATLSYRQVVFVSITWAFFLACLWVRQDWSEVPMVMEAHVAVDRSPSSLLSPRGLSPTYPFL